MLPASLHHHSSCGCRRVDRFGQAAESRRAASPSRSMSVSSIFRGQRAPHVRPLTAAKPKEQGKASLDLRFGDIERIARAWRPRRLGRSHRPPAFFHPTPQACIREPVVVVAVKEGIWIGNIAQVAAECILNKPLKAGEETVSKNLGPWKIVTGQSQLQLTPDRRKPENGMHNLNINL